MAYNTNNANRMSPTLLWQLCYNHHPVTNKY